ncbi:MAG: DUF418 domain-containing protein [Bacteroidaceae bacterium]
MEQIIRKNSRVEVVDALRGFAVMAILMVHNLEHFIYPVYPTDSPAWLKALDEGVINTVFSLFAGKAYAIFALLFGFTFFIQTSNSRKVGKDFGWRFLWRMVLLVGFATLNAAFYPGGDVLLMFAVVSIVLFFTRNLSDKVVLVVAIFFLLQPVEWFLYLWSLFDASFTLPDLKVGEYYSEVFASTSGGNVVDFFWNNITVGQKASFFWAVGCGRIYQTAGMFLLGFYLGRRRLFELSGGNARFWVKLLIVSAVAFAPLFTIKEMVMKSDAIVQQTAGAAFDMWQKMSFTFVLVSSVVLLYQSEKFSKCVSSLRFYGRMSLTNYITQSIVGALIYFPVGLNLAPFCGMTVSLLIGFLVCFVQVLFCKWWLGRHKQGPLEFLWHKWTWIKR